MKRWLAISALVLFSLSVYSQNCPKELSPALCAKIGQMLIVGFGGLKEVDGKVVWQDPDASVFKPNSLIAKNINQYGIGGIILFERPFFSQKTGIFLKDRNIQNPNQLRKLIDDLQAYAKQVATTQHRSTLPLIVSLDQEGGMVDRLPYYRGFVLRYPIPQAYGAYLEQKKGNRVASYADQLAKQLADLHINLDFSPDIDLNINPLNPIIGAMGRSVSQNPKIVADVASQFITAFNAHNIIPTMKHFPGHGSSQSDSHDNLVDVTTTYQISELQPYRQLINNGYDGVIMTTHVINGKIDKTQCKPGAKDDPTTWCPATMSQATLTTLLRKQLGFKGVIVSDDMMMGAIAKQYPLDLSLEKAINAGVDIFIISNNDSDNTAVFYNTIVKLVQSGRIRASQIDEAYERIVKLKKKLTLGSKHLVQ